ncbi:lipid-A-disaccharide synthase [Marinospirillum alkaliphilum]|uniref:Lipid-A-disaccharide synthase n=1 Tax=Marinospirillum alkaliphilum DSM 21637 TaxID=1122209 RepID=A0A1K1W216_9GAMM|nr:lipid-A-disaccharide synthase [Marinospirillum alkaliphilum]SFX31457.1 lipid-A-disaccharide synthase [Marinospirillum alkaliphilum DSM 21637]
MKIYLVAGEISGDILGGNLIPALKARWPNAEFRGLGGDQMQAQGLTSLYPLETLSVMGLVEVLKHLPQLIRVRRHLLRDALEWGADLMIGIDAPDFNLGLEHRLRKQGIKTVHYVSPSVWAWRQGRIKGIRKSTDLMLALLPFEATFYHQHQMPVAFIGHPTADKVPLQPDRAAARQAFGLDEQALVIGLLPGSRGSEISRLGPLFLQTAQALKKLYPHAVFLLPAASSRRHDELTLLLQEYPIADLQLIQGQSDKVMQAATVCLMNSGTSTLEGMFCKTPMVVSYKMAPFSWWLLKRLIKIKWASLPNLLANKPLVTECLQQDATVEKLVPALQQLLDHPDALQAQTEAFLEMHQQLRRNASAEAVKAIDQLLNGTLVNPTRP